VKLIAIFLSASITSIYPVAKRRRKCWVSKNDCPIRLHCAIGLDQSAKYYTFSLYSKNQSDSSI